MSQAPTPRPGVRRRALRGPHDWAWQAPLLLWLVLLWMLLWDDLSWGNAVGGTLLALGVTQLCYLPPVDVPRRLGPRWVVAFVLHFAVDLVRASWQVVLVSLRPRCAPASAVVAVRLHTSSDLLTTLTALAVTLIPGSLVVEVDRRDRVLYLHVLDAPTDDHLDRVRRDVHRYEERLIRAIGSREECAALDAEAAGAAEAADGTGGRRR